MIPPTSELREELSALLARDDTRLGDVHRLTNRGMNAQEIADHLGVATSGFVSNCRIQLKAILDGVIPASPNISHGLSRRIVTVLRDTSLSVPVRTYLEQLGQELNHAATLPPTRTLAPRASASTYASVPPPASSPAGLREAVDREIRNRSAALIRRIGAEVGVDADDYHRIVIASFALDQIIELVQRQSSSRSSVSLFKVGRADLTIEQAVVDWAADLPLSTDLVATVRARLDFWRNP